MTHVVNEVQNFEKLTIAYILSKMVFSSQNLLYVSGPSSLSHFSSPFLVLLPILCLFASYIFFLLAAFQKLYANLLFRNRNPWNLLPAHHQPFSNQHCVRLTYSWSLQMPSLQTSRNLKRKRFKCFVFTRAKHLAVCSNLLIVSRAHLLSIAISNVILYIFDAQSIPFLTRRLHPDLKKYVDGVVKRLLISHTRSTRR